MYNIYSYNMVYIIVLKYICDDLEACSIEIEKLLRDGRWQNPDAMSTVRLHHALSTSNVPR